jgi:hypothetical protein
MAKSGPEPESEATTAVPGIEQTVANIREMNERLIESSKTAGTGALDAYEKALQGMLDFEQKVAGASQLDWVTALAETHVRFVQDLSGAYIKAARDSLK